MTQKEKRLKELELRLFSDQLVLIQGFKDLLEVFIMFLLGLVKDNDVLQVNHHTPPKKVLKSLIHESSKRERRVSHSKIHETAHKRSIMHT